MRHPRARGSISAIGVTTLLVALSGSNVARAGSGATFSVSPTGMGHTCTPAAPCGLRTALNHAASGDEIVLATGSYRTPATAFTDGLNDEGKALNIHGAAGQVAPVIYSKATNAFGLSTDSALSHVVISSTGTGYALSALGATVDHVAVFTSGTNAFACAVFGPLTDSLCDSSGLNGTALSYSNDANSPVTSAFTVSNVTALATGTNGVGIHVIAGRHVTLQVTATNTISVATRYSVLAEATAATSTAIVKLDHCASGVESAKFPKGTATISNTNNVSDPPVFVDPVHSDFRERASSPTVDAGATVAGGDTDLAGNRRILGSAPDIGAFELPEKPAVSKFKVGKVTKHTAHLSVTVNPEGLDSTVRVVVRHAGTSHNSHTESAGSGHNAKTIHVTLHGLKRHTKYNVVAVGANTAGTDKSTRRSLHTDK